MKDFRHYVEGKNLLTKTTIEQGFQNEDDALIAFVEFLNNGFHHVTCTNLVTGEKVEDFRSPDYRESYFLSDLDIETEA